jgi:caffeoyl-CoA O-methyltransferase
VLEIGTFSGYSALSMAAGLPADGRLVTCEIDPDVAEVARRHIETSPYGDRIEQRVGPALETLEELDGPFDLVFVDADKQGYPAYVDAVLPKLAERGLIAIDNTLWSGRVVRDGDPDESTRALMDLNDRLRSDPGLVCALLTVRDGITLVRRAVAA